MSGRRAAERAREHAGAVRAALEDHGVEFINVGGYTGVGGEGVRQRRKPETIQLRVSAVEYQALRTAAQAKRMQIATLILDTLRAQGILGKD